MKKWDSPEICGRKLVGVFDAVTHVRLGYWDEDTFDISICGEEMTTKLDGHFRTSFKSGRRPTKPILKSARTSNVGLSFLHYLSGGPIEKGLKPSSIKSLDDFYRLASNVRIRIGAPVDGAYRAEQNFSISKNLIEHSAPVELTFARYSKRLFEMSPYAEAIARGDMILEAIYVRRQ